MLSFGNKAGRGGDIGVQTPLCGNGQVLIKGFGDRGIPADEGVAFLGGVGGIGYRLIVAAVKNCDLGAVHIDESDGVLGSLDLIHAGAIVLGSVAAGSQIGCGGTGAERAAGDEAFGVGAGNLTGISAARQSDVQALGGSALNVHFIEGVGALAGSGNLAAVDGDIDGQLGAVLGDRHGCAGHSHTA